MTGPLKAAWALVLFVVVVGIVGWATSGRAVFAVFIVLGVLTGGAALVAFRSTPSGPSSAEERK
ncbi:hypothetical protein O2W14_11845 [Modestobacter sp. VKM Ac-2986]|jgi:hypothetical protein|uniref:hypothetical protein n=1 Tax=Modestobacter sp. VKM Ac-2986 TaxID=3004140 RepID=UPI0022ABAF5B|nr:hypothetical protein [Modestobacter sp. VKM Ac-2986]MCZ2829526.1 hypothetical protein [Modestobacter sp. VKM Ac-2986]